MGQREKRRLAAFNCANASAKNEAKRPRKGSTYQYLPLEPAKREIRLLRVDPGKPGSRLWGELFHASLGEDACFDALSYMWGPPKPVYQIQLPNGRTLDLGRNLRKALDAIRRHDRPRIIWADAICINQQDHHERASQVRLMRQIYSTAQTVCSWIDHNAEPRGVVFDDAKQLGQGVEIDDYHDPSHWQPVADIFRNPYWTRLWVQQELILAREIEVYCRHSVFSGDTLLRFQQKVIRSTEANIGRFDHPGRKIFEYMHEAGRPLMGGVLHAKQALARAHSQQKHSKESETEFLVSRTNMMSIFLNTANLLVTDPRDRLYGILGLMTDEDEDAVILDYTAPVLRVHAQAFRIFLDRYQNLVFLCSTTAKSDLPPSSLKNAPSWMPNSVSWATASASNAQGPSKALKAMISPDGRLLTLKGFMVDKVSFVGSRTGLSMQRCKAWLSTVDSYCQRIWPDGNSQRPLYEKDSITSLFFPWVLPARYRLMYRSEMPTAQERLEIVRQLLDAETRFEQQGGFVETEMGYHPPSTLSNVIWERCRPMHATLGLSVFVGTEGKRLGTMPKGARAEVDNSDQIWIIFGCPMPIVLRPIPGKQGRFTHVGPIVLPGLMHGEAFAGPASSSGQYWKDWEDNVRGTSIELE